MSYIINNHRSGIDVMMENHEDVYVPSHASPFPDQPALHVHEIVPLLLLQYAWVWHVCLSLSHSAMSELCNTVEAEIFQRF